MKKRPADRSGSSIGQQAGSALDSLVHPAQAVVNSVRETVSSALSGMAGFMKEPSDTMSRRTESAMRMAAEVVRPKPSKRAVRGVQRKTPAAIETTARAAARRVKPTARRTATGKRTVSRGRVRPQL